ncbi:MAG: hypothetical protein IID33_11685 [Planctomycetes bacterium]|nr:hypothetical protein [Planctomycetota bacterium]
MREALDIRQERFPAGHADIVSTLERLVALYDKWGEPQEAAKYRGILPPEADKPK